MRSLLYTVLVLGMISCRQKNPAIEGVYIRIASGEYSTAADTLIVYPPDNASHSCIVHRKTGFIRRDEKGEYAKEYRDESMLIIYDPATQQGRDNRTGRVFVFRKKELLFGAAVYKKE